MLRTVDEVEQYFPRFISFIDSTTEQQQIPRPIDKKRRDMMHTIQVRRKDTLL